MTTLKAALQEAYFMELEELPSEEILSEDEALTFSPAFERKMKKLIRRADHPIRYRIAQAAACLLLAALLSGCTVLAVSPEARAAFVGWVRETYETWFVYRYTGEEQLPSEDIVYAPTWVPEGYSELKESISDDQVVIVYRNDEGYLLAFTYTKNRESVSAYVLLDNQETDVQAVLVSGKIADLYLEQQADKASILVWDDDEKGVFFAISAHCSVEELIKIAESVEAVQ